MTQRSCLSIILAAGEGTRMKSAKPKVLHEIAGLPMVAHVAAAARAAGGGDVALVIGHGADEVRKAAARLDPSPEIFVQEQRLGTGHAVLAARAAIARGYDDILVMFGDTPLIEAEALLAIRQELADGAAVVVVGFRPADPAGYGRLIERGGKLVAIREEKDASDTEKKDRLLQWRTDGDFGQPCARLAERRRQQERQGRILPHRHRRDRPRAGLDVVATEASAESVLGINNRAELAEAEGIWQRRRRREAMLSGVTLIAPETVHFSHDTEIGPDTLVEPNVWFGPGVKIASGATIHAFSHIEGASIATGSEVGPFARLRPGADLREKAKVGNFVEVKKASIGQGAKVSHLTYIGDAVIGAEANIGAGTITVNYDGYGKHLTEVGRGAFIGSNSSLVAPVKVGDRANVAAGSVITEDVEADALAFGRARQKTLPGKGKELRERFAAAAAQKKKAD